MERYTAPARKLCLDDLPACSSPSIALADSLVHMGIDALAADKLTMPPSAQQRRVILAHGPHVSNTGGEKDAERQSSSLRTSICASPAYGPSTALRMTKEASELMPDTVRHHPTGVPPADFASNRHPLRPQRSSMAQITSTSLRADAFDDSLLERPTNGAMLLAGKLAIGSVSRISNAGSIPSHSSAQVAMGPVPPPPSSAMVLSSSDACCNSAKLDSDTDEHASPEPAAKRARLWEHETHIRVDATAAGVQRVAYLTSHTRPGSQWVIAPAISGASTDWLHAGSPASAVDVAAASAAQTSTVPLKFSAGFQSTHDATAPQARPALGAAPKCTLPEGILRTLAFGHAEEAGLFSTTSVSAFPWWRFPLSSTSQIIASHAAALDRALCAFRGYRQPSATLRSLPTLQNLRELLDGDARFAGEMCCEDSVSTLQSLSSAACGGVTLDASACLAAVGVLNGAYLLAEDLVDEEAPSSSHAADVRERRPAASSAGEPDGTKVTQGTDELLAVDINDAFIAEVERQYRAYVLSMAATWGFPDSVADFVGHRTTSGRFPLRQPTSAHVQAGITMIEAGIVQHCGRHDGRYQEGCITSRTPTVGTSGQKRPRLEMQSSSDHACMADVMSLHSMDVPLELQLHLRKHVVQAALIVQQHVAHGMHLSSLGTAASESSSPSAMSSVHAGPSGSFAAAFERSINFVTLHHRLDAAFAESQKMNISWS